MNCELWIASDMLIEHLFNQIHIILQIIADVQLVQ